MPPTVRLKVSKGALIGEEFVFAERNTCIIGRASDCSPRLPDDDQHSTISRHHCLLDINPPDIRIRDFGSLNGTYVNGAKIGQREQHQSPKEAAALAFAEHDLGEGDEIELGDTTFRVVVSVPPVCRECGKELNPRPSPGSGPEPRCKACAKKEQDAARGARAAREKTKLLKPKARPAERGEPVEPAVGMARPKRCVNCDRELPEKAAGRAGYVLCGDCLAEPEKVLRRLMERVGEIDRRVGGRDLPPFQGYTLLGELGRGGMGAVYLAQENNSGRKVALKVMLPRVAARAEARARFLREIELSRKLQHRHIAAIYDVGNARGAFFFTIEYCPGGSLDQLAAQRGGTLSVGESVPLIMQALDGLEHAHNHGVVHRDLTPQNILLGANDKAPQAKVCDFGIAKAFDQAGLSGLTRTGMAAGKPYFIPRQQVINFKHSQPEVDVWASAACLYWLLTGHHPRDFPARKDPWQVVLQDAAVPIRQRNRSIPGGLAEVIDEALRDNPVIGFRSAKAFRRALRRAF